MLNPRFGCRLKSGWSSPRGPCHGGCTSSAPRPSDKRPPWSPQWRWKRSGRSKDSKRRPERPHIVYLSVYTYYIILYHIIWYHIISYHIRLYYIIYYIILYMCVCHMVICTYCLDDTFWVWVKLQKAKIAGNVGCFDANLRRPKASVSQCVSRWPRSRPVKKCWLVSKIWNCTPSHASSWLFL